MTDTAEPTRASVRCPICGHTDAVPGDHPRALCTECAARAVPDADVDHVVHVDGFACWESAEPEGTVLEPYDERHPAWPPHQRGPL